MRLDFHLTSIVPQMVEAKITWLMAQNGDALRVGSPLLEIEVDLSRFVGHDCPPISHFRIVLREPVILRRWAVSEGDIASVGQLLALFTQTAEESSDVEPARKVRVNAASVISRWNAIG